MNKIKTYKMNNINKKQADSQHESPVILPNDIDDFLTYVIEKDSWVFHKEVWKKYGWRDRTTQQLYELYQRYKP